MTSPSHSSVEHLKNFGSFADSMRKAGVMSSRVIDGIKLEYCSKGNGENSLVFLHGNSSFKEIFLQQFEYFDNKGFTLIAIDLPGHGGSDNAVEAEEQYTIPAYAAIVNQLLEQLEVRDYILVGWSLGGNIGLEMMASNDSMQALALFGAPPVGPGAENFEKAYLPATFDTAMQDADPNDDEISLFAKSIYSGLDTIPELFIDAARRTDGRAREVMVTHWLSGVSGNDQLQTVKESKQQICVMQGSNEPFVSLVYLKTANWNKLWKNKIHIIEDSAHAPFIENAPQFNALLESFALDSYQ